MTPLRLGDIDTMNPEETGCFWRDSETHCDRIINKDPIPEVHGLRDIQNELESVIADQDGQGVSPLDPIWNGLDELQSRRDHEYVNLSLGWHFFDDDGK